MKTEWDGLGCGVQITLYSLKYVVCGVQDAVWDLWCTEFRVHCALARSHDTTPVIYSDLNNPICPQPTPVQSGCGKTHIIMIRILNFSIHSVG